MFGPPMEETIRRESILNDICSANHMVSRCDITSKFEMKIEIAKVEAIAPMLKKTVSMLAEEVDAGNGYRIALRDHFPWGRPGQEYLIPGLFLTLLNSDDKVVGVIGFRVGLPIYITCIQGTKSKWHGNLVQEAQKATGNSFDELLVRRMFQCAGATLRFKEYELLRGSPKIAFRLPGNEPSQETLKRMSKYVKKSERAGFVYGKVRGHAFVRPRLVSRHSVGAERQCAQKKPALLR